MGYNFRPPGILERLFQVKSADKGGNTELKRCLTLFPLMVQGLAHMLGAGIFVVTPSIIQSVAGPATCISYLLSGLAAGLSVICYSDLASRYSCSGSAYVYTYFSLGECAAAIIGFFLIGELIIQSPMLTLGLADNIDLFIFNGTVHAWEGEYFPAWFLNTELIAIGTMICFTVINLYGIKIVAYINIAIAGVSVLTLLIFCGVALAKGSVENLHKVVNPEDGRTGFAPFGFSGILSGAGIAFFAFVGLEAVVTLGEEAVNPKRDLPRATIGSFLMVLVLYVLTAFSIAFFVPWYELTGNTGLIGSLRNRGFKAEEYILTAGLIFTVFACGLCNLTTVIRVVYSVAEDGLVFSFLSIVNKRTQVPMWNVLVCGTLGIGTSIVYDFDTLSHMISGGTLMVFMLTAVAVMILSYDISDRELPVTKSEKTRLIPLPQGRFNISTSRKRHFIICQTVFFISAILLSSLLTYFSQTTLIICMECVLFLMVLTSLSLIRLNIPLKEGEELLSFKSPFKPFVQGFSILINLLLLLHLKPVALQQLSIYAVVGLVVYLCYGIFFSKITNRKQNQFVIQLTAESDDTNKLPVPDTADGLPK